MTRILKLQKKLKESGVDAYLVPMRDEFGCEYVPPQFRRLEYITGFTGSNGFAVITKNKNAFFTDGRYTLQATLEIDKNEFDIFDISEKTEAEWLSENFKQRSKIGFDPALFSISTIKKYKQKLDEKNIKLVELQKNLVDEIWDNRPKASETNVFIHDKKFAGKKASEKIKEITAKMKGDFLLLASSESICWLLNIRGNDLEKTPVTLCYAILHKKGDIYFYGNLKALQKIENKIDADIHIRQTHEIFSDLKQYSGKKIELDANITPAKFKNILEKNKCEIIESTDPCVIARAIKNPTEIESARNAHIRDGAAICKFFHWLDKNHKTGKLTEISLAEKLEDIRKKGENFFSLSFDTIAGWKANGAIVHYRANPKTAAKIEGNGILLLDSGAQYLDGTTDITRTTALGKPSLEQKRNFTLVLKGHIALASAKFIKGTSGANLDVLARQFLWQHGLDYKHGTGHGVGFFLNVHEGPHGINRVNTTSLQPGMIISNEPGFYKEGEYGIRIESLVLVANSKTKGFYEFETLTKAPIDKNLIDKTLLTPEEVDWLNNYHDDVYKKLSPLLNVEEKNWLKEATKKLTTND